MSRSGKRPNGRHIGDARLWPWQPVILRGGESAVERAALEWLEQAPAPALYASDSDHRSAVETYVPVNDEHGGQPTAFATVARISTHTPARRMCLLRVAVGARQRYSRGLGIGLQEGNANRPFQFGGSNVGGGGWNGTRPQLDSRGGHR